MRIRKSILVSMIALGVIGLAATPLLASDHDETKVRWDIIQISVSGSVITVSPGGMSTSVAALIPSQGTGDDSTITLTGKGTFEPGERHEVTGGGTWATAKKDGTPIASGTYRVTEFLFWKESGGSLPPGIIDTIGNPANVVTGLAILRVKYSDREEGIIVVSCNFGPPAPAAAFEGTTATKGVVDYSNPISAADASTGNTFFHLMREDD
jgi:hypothetical protein